MLDADAPCCCWAGSLSSNAAANSARRHRARCNPLDDKLAERGDGWFAGVALGQLSGIQALFGRDFQASTIWRIVSSSDCVMSQLG